MSVEGWAQLRLASAQSQTAKTTSGQAENHCCKLLPAIMPLSPSLLGALTSLLLLNAFGMHFAKTLKRGPQLASTAQGAVLLHPMHVSVRFCRLAARGPSPAAGVPCRMRRRWRWGSGLHRGRVCGSASQASLVSAGQHTTPSAPLLPPPPAAPNATHWPKIYSHCYCKSAR